MKSNAHFMLVLVICLIIVPREIGGHVPESETENVTGGAAGQNLIDKVCDKTASKDVCVKTLKSDPLLHHGRANATVKDLAISFLRVASKNASSLIYELKVLIENDRLPPQVQQGLSDCSDMLLDAEDQIDIALSAILSNASYDAKKWLQVALDATDLCEASLRGNEQVMLNKSNAFRDLCVIANSICNQL